MTASPLSFSFQWLAAVRSHWKVGSAGGGFQCEGGYGHGQEQNSQDAEDAFFYVWILLVSEMFVDSLTKCAKMVYNNLVKECWKGVGR